MINISVNASKDYDVIMEQGILKEAGFYIRKALGMNALYGKEPEHKKKVCIVTDETVNELYGEKSHALWRSLESVGFDVYKYVFPGGEEFKTVSTVEKIMNHLTDNMFSRSDILIAFGGGIVGDVTGFTAASFLRGIDYIQVPTTLLAVVDSSVGGKTGVNLRAGKNLAGAFWQPRLVLFDSDVMETLSYDLKLDGIAEAIKAGIIAQPLILDSITHKINLDDPQFIMDLAAMAIEVKRDVVERDERDEGCRQLLNLGHTPAHAIEKCSNFKIRHGHAVAMGISIITKTSANLGWTSQKDCDTIITVLKKFKFPLKCPYSADELAKTALYDKKIRGDEITLVIPSAIGDCRLKNVCTDRLQKYFALGMPVSK